MTLEERCRLAFLAGIHDQGERSGRPLHGNADAQNAIESTPISKAACTAIGG